MITSPGSWGSIRKMRRFLILVCILAAIYPATSDIQRARAASWTFVQGKSASADASGTAADVTVTSTGSGHLLACWTGWEGTTGSTVTCSDATTTFTDGTLKDSGAVTSPSNDAHDQWHYLLVSASGKTTIQCRWTSARTFKRCHVYEFSYSGTAALDTQVTNANTGTAVTSTNYTATSTDEVNFGSYKEYSSNLVTSPLVNAVAADGSINNSPAGSNAATWYRVTTAGFTGASTATCSGCGGVGWLDNAISFSASGGGGATCPKTLSLLGAGC